MTELLEDAIERAKALPGSRQDELAHLLMTAIETDLHRTRLTPSQVEDVKNRLLENEGAVGSADVRAALLIATK